jgi:hypothetical protein
MNWQLLDLQPSPQTDQLGTITGQLYQSVFALEALLGDSSDPWERVAEHLNLTSVLSGWLQQRNQSGLQSSLNADEARSLVLVICHLARQHQVLIRRGINLVEQLTQQNQPLDQVTLLRDYLLGFSQRYQKYIHPHPRLSTEEITSLALKSLIDLLFYSHPNSPQPFWLALVT